MITLGNKNELFLDDTLLESAEGVRFDWLRPERHGCVFRYDAPWEGEACTYQTLIQHPETGKIYLYYRGTSVTNNDFSLEQVTCLAVSDDGVHFDRVDTGRGNIVLADVSLYLEVFINIVNAWHFGLPRLNLYLIQKIKICDSSKSHGISQILRCSCRSAERRQFVHGGT